MKKILYYVSMMMFALVGFTSCEKELMDYEGVEALYFDVRLYPAHLDDWPHRLHTAVSFGATMEDEIEVVVPVRATGAMKDYDRPFSIEIVNDSTTAIEGMEFDGLVKERVIKAGTLSDTIKFKAHRTATIDNDTVRLQLRIIPNSYFETPFKDYDEDSPYYRFVTFNSKVDQPNSGSQLVPEFDLNTDAGIHNIFFFDTLVKPGGWWGTALGGTWGLFSAKKMRLIMELCGCDLDAFESTSTMPSARATSYGEKVGKYLIEQAKLGRDHAVLDEDGTMMWVNYCTTGDPYYRWGQGYKPEDCAFFNR